MESSAMNVDQIIESNLSRQQNRVVDASNFALTQKALQIGTNPYNEQLVNPKASVIGCPGTMPVSSVVRNTAVRRIIDIESHGTDNEDYMFVINPQRTDGTIILMKRNSGSDMSYFYLDEINPALIWDVNFTYVRSVHHKIRIQSDTAPFGNLDLPGMLQGSVVRNLPIGREQITAQVLSQNALFPNSVTEYTKLIDGLIAITPPYNSNPLRTLSVQPQAPVAEWLDGDIQTEVTQLLTLGGNYTRASTTVGIPNAELSFGGSDICYVNFNSVGMNQPAVTPYTSPFGLFRIQVRGLEQQLNANTTFWLRVYNQFKNGAGVFTFIDFQLVSDEIYLNIKNFVNGFKVYQMTGAPGFRPAAFSVTKMMPVNENDQCPTQIITLEGPRAGTALTLSGDFLFELIPGLRLQQSMPVMPRASPQTQDYFAAHALLSAVCKAIGSSIYCFTVGDFELVKLYMLHPVLSQRENQVGYASWWTTIAAILPEAWHIGKKVIEWIKEHKRRNTGKASTHGQVKIKVDDRKRVTYISSEDEVDIGAESLTQTEPASQMAFGTDIQPADACCLTGYIQLTKSEDVTKIQMLDLFKELDVELIQEGLYKYLRVRSTTSQYMYEFGIKYRDTLDNRVEILFIVDTESGLVPSVWRPSFDNNLRWPALLSFVVDTQNKYLFAWPDPDHWLRHVNVSDEDITSLVDPSIITSTRQSETGVIVDKFNLTDQINMTVESFDQDNGEEEKVNSPGDRTNITGSYFANLQTFREQFLATFTPHIPESRGLRLSFDPEGEGCFYQCVSLLAEVPVSTISPNPGPVPYSEVIDIVSRFNLTASECNTGVYIVLTKDYGQTQWHAMLICDSTITEADDSDEPDANPIPAQSLSSLLMETMALNRNAEGQTVNGYTVYGRYPCVGTYMGKITKEPLMVFYSGAEPSKWQFRQTFDPATEGQGDCLVRSLAYMVRQIVMAMEKRGHETQTVSEMLKKVMDEFESNQGSHYVVPAEEAKLLMYKRVKSLYFVYAMLDLFMSIGAVQNENKQIEVQHCLVMTREDQAPLLDDVSEGQWVLHAAQLIHLILDLKQIRIPIWTAPHGFAYIGSGVEEIKQSQVKYHDDEEEGENISDKEDEAEEVEAGYYFPFIRPDSKFNDYCQLTISTHNPKRGIQIAMNDIYNHLNIPIKGGSVNVYLSGDVNPVDEENSPWVRPASINVIRTLKSIFEQYLDTQGAWYVIFKSHDKVRITDYSFMYCLHALLENAPYGIYTGAYVKTGNMYGVQEQDKKDWTTKFKIMMQFQINCTWGAFIAVCADPLNYDAMSEGIQGIGSIVSGSRMNRDAMRAIQDYNAKFQRNKKIRVVYSVAPEETFIRIKGGVDGERAAQLEAEYRACQKKLDDALRQLTEAQGQLNEERLRCSSLQEQLDSVRAVGSMDPSKQERREEYKSRVQEKYMKEFNVPGEYQEFGFGFKESRMRDRGQQLLQQQFGQEKTKKKKGNAKPQIDDQISAIVDFYQLDGSFDNYVNIMRTERNTSWYGNLIVVNPGYNGGPYEDLAVLAKSSQPGHYGKKFLSLIDLCQSVPNIYENVLNLLRKTDMGASHYKKLGMVERGTYNNFAQQLQIIFVAMSRNACDDRLNQDDHSRVKSFIKRIHKTIGDFTAGLSLTTVENQIKMKMTVFDSVMTAVVSAQADQYFVFDLGEYIKFDEYALKYQHHVEPHILSAVQNYPGGQLSMQVVAKAVQGVGRASHDAFAMRKRDESRSTSAKRGMEQDVFYHAFKDKYAGQVPMGYTNTFMQRYKERSGVPNKGQAVNPQPAKKQQKGLIQYSDDEEEKDIDLGRQKPATMTVMRTPAPKVQEPSQTQGLKRSNSRTRKAGTQGGGDPNLKSQFMSMFSSSKQQQLGSDESDGEDTE